MVHTVITTIKKYTEKKGIQNDNDSLKVGFQFENLKNLLLLFKFPIVYLYYCFSTLH